VRDEAQNQKNTIGAGAYLSDNDRLPAVSGGYQISFWPGLVALVARDDNDNLQEGYVVTLPSRSSVEAY
jgi:hypothetical protein